MLKVTAAESPTVYIFTVTDGTEENTFVYEWGKIPPEGQEKTDYIQSCKREALLLAEDEIARKQPPKEIKI